uniref:Uncharacterized protein n=1 Tax=Panagrolaimus davidi TaxID=227884 RepID=A0A914PMA6_9BILA
MTVFPLISLTGKHETIDEIWQDDSGIIHLPIFPLIYVQEAEVNEACMIYAVELSLPRAAFQLKNKKKGTFRREETKFTNAQEMELGVYNLWCAWKVFEHRRNIPVNYRHFPESRHHQY